MTQRNTKDPPSNDTIEKANECDRNSIKRTTELSVFRSVPHNKAIRAAQRAVRLVDAGMEVVIQFTKVLGLADALRVAGLLGYVDAAARTA